MTSGLDTAAPPRRGAYQRPGRLLLMRMSVTSAARVRRIGPWAFTLAATVVSTCALDLFATACGLLLVGSGLLAGIDHGLALALLAVSYLVWGAGLRVSLHANADLLEQTGASTNALSKLGWDAAARCGHSVRTQRLAAAGGYLLCELAKEIPYYAGAFGAAVVGSSIDATDALVFLIGSGFGAGAYEAALGRGTWAILRRQGGGPDGRT